jgi:membrane-bound ClpP family serine protease
MDWIRHQGQTVGWICFILAFVIVAMAPDRAWLALPLYSAAAILFALVIFERRRRSGGG